GRNQGSHGGRPWRTGELTPAATIFSSRVARCRFLGSPPSLPGFLRPSGKCRSDVVESRLAAVVWFDYAFRTASEAGYCRRGFRTFARSDSSLGLHLPAVDDQPIEGRSARTKNPASSRKVVPRGHGLLG